MVRGLCRNYHFNQQVPAALVGWEPQLVQSGCTGELRLTPVLQGAVRPGWVGLNYAGPEAPEDDRKGLEFIWKY